MAPENSNIVRKPGFLGTLVLFVPSCVNPGKAQTLFVLLPIRSQNTTALACLQGPLLNVPLWMGKTSQTLPTGDP